jgi:hypothetical protein
MTQCFLKYGFSEMYCYVVGVTIDGVRNGDSIFDHIYTRLIKYNLQITDTDTYYCPQSITVSTSRFLAKDFNTGTFTVSLNYTLQISHMKSSLNSRTIATLISGHYELMHQVNYSLYNVCVCVCVCVSACFWLYTYTISFRHVLINLASFVSTQNTSTSTMWCNTLS